MEEIVKQQKELLGSDSCKHSAELLNNGPETQEQGEGQLPELLEQVPPEKLVRTHLMHHASDGF